MRVVAPLILFPVALTRSAAKRQGMTPSHIKTARHSHENPAASEGTKQHQSQQQQSQDLKSLGAAIQTVTTQIALHTKTEPDEAKRAETLSTQIAKELGEGDDPQAVLKTFVPFEEALKTLAQSCQASTSATTRLKHE